MKKALVLIMSVAALAIMAGSFLFPKNISAAALEVGATAPAFELKNVDGSMVSLASGAGELGTMVVFTCNHCPFAIAYEDRLIELANEFQPKGIKFIAINPNDPKIKPEDNYEAMQKRADEKKLPYPYLVNEDGSIATAYGATRTPESFLLDKSGKIIYAGRIDDNTEVKDVKEHDLHKALTNLVEGHPDQIDPKMTKAFGCTIKFRK